MIRCLPLAPIDDIVVVVAEADGAPVPHRGGIGVSRTDAEVAGPPVAAVGWTVRIKPSLLQQPPWWIVPCELALGVDLDRQPYDAFGQIVCRRWHCLLRGEFVRKEVSDVSLRFVIEAGDQRRDADVGLNLRRIEVELPAPDQAGVLTEVDDLLEEALEEVDAQPLPDAGQAGVVRQLFAEGVAEIPAVGQVETGRFDELALGADALEEHDELELEEDHRVDRGTAAFGIQVAYPLTNKGQIERRFEVAVEVVSRNEFLQ
jgi:hypothetical protein